MKSGGKTDELYDKLRDAYTEPNLTKISAQIIEAFRKKQFRYIKGLYKSLREFLATDEQSFNKVFSSLIMLYHPDRLKHYLSQLDGLSTASSKKDLHPFTHILIILEKLNKTAFIEEIEPEINYAMDDLEYGYQEDEFDRIIDVNGDYFQDFEGMEGRWDAPMVRDFLQIMREKEGLDDDDDIMQFHLENMEGTLDLSSSSLNDLAGIEHCVNLNILDLSSNQLFDVTPLGYVRSLQELYLSGNEIFSIDALGLLEHVKILDLSFNNIEDLTPLHDLQTLEYVNLVGNTIPRDQVEFLRSRGVLVVI